MRVNILTRGQSVRVTRGKYMGETGYIKRIQFIAQLNRAEHIYTVRLRSACGVLKYSADYIEVCHV